ncbi:MAG TPA: polyketide cyclase, partial [Chloroflexota bacterium]|nr:polyketide cyclase [Chloroflexota bacterium]
QTLISVSLATFEFKPQGSGSRLVMTEQDAFLDGYDDKGSREEGSRLIMDALEREIKRQLATA